jgi:hypothetical protein
VAGYSGRSLAEKLGLKAGMKALIVNPSDTILYELPADTDATIRAMIPKTKSIYLYIHYFATQEASLTEGLPLLKQRLEKNGMIWISWPKRSAKQIANIETDLSENTIRKHALSVGLVDVKVCAVDDVWSALKLVIPLKNRQKK